MKSMIKLQRTQNQKVKCSNWITKWEGAIHITGASNHGLVSEIRDVLL